MLALPLAWRVMHASPTRQITRARISPDRGYRAGGSSRRCTVIRHSQVAAAISPLSPPGRRRTGGASAVRATPLPSADQLPAVGCVPCPAVRPAESAAAPPRTGRPGQGNRQGPAPGRTRPALPLVRPVIERGRGDHQTEGRRGPGQLPRAQGGCSAVPTTGRSRSSAPAARATAIMAGAASIPASTSTCGARAASRPSR
jgi:hypothetical protein